MSSEIVSTGYSIGADEEDSTNTSVLTRQRSLGTGVLLTADGYIVTNAHVVQGSRRLRVQLPAAERETSGKNSVVLPGGRVVDAKVVGMDRETDLAVVKVEEKGLSHLSFGDSESLHHGQLVFAFGSPMGLENSVSMGVISSTARQIKIRGARRSTSRPTRPSIPATAAGRWSTSTANIVGINTFILSQSGGSEGLGFAIPSNIVTSMFEQIRKEGHVHRGQMGVRAQSVTAALSSGLGLSRESGVLAADVAPDGPAEEAGLKIGDIILAMNGKPMENARQFDVNVYRHSVGDSIKLTVLRDAQQLELTVEVGERDDDPQRFADLVDPEKNQVRKLGILGVEITEKLSALLPELRKPYGVVVAARIGSGPVAAELQPGDIIHEINGAPIATIEALRGSPR